MDIKKYIVSILDEQYSIVSDESEAALHSAAHRLDSLMRDIVEKAPSLDRKKVAVLAALRLATELEQITKKQRACDDSAELLSSVIDQALRENEY